MKIMEVVKSRSLFRKMFEQNQEVRTKSQIVCLIQVILLMVGHWMLCQEERKHVGRMVWLTVSSRKKADSGKSGRKVEIKTKQKGRQSQLSTQLGKVTRSQIW